MYDSETCGEPFVTHQSQVTGTLYRGEFSKPYNVTTQDFKLNDDVKKFIMNEKHQLVEESAKPD